MKIVKDTLKYFDLNILLLMEELAINQALREHVA